VNIDCDRGALAVSEAVAHDPAGVRAAWDVQLTSYEVADGEAQAQRTVELATGLTDAQLEQLHPELGGQRMFAGCEKR
jgi:hypothetical protein